MIKTKEVYEDSLVTIEEVIEKVCNEERITKDNLIDIKYLRTKTVTPYIDDDNYIDKDSFSTEVEVSALMIWDDGK